jgi:hypothetical protein
MNKAATDSDRRHLDVRTLIQENRQFAGTTGVSANNRGLGFSPGFLDTVTGTVYLSRFPNGMPAPIHVLATLPAELVEETGTTPGADLSIKRSVISGFVRDGIFYSREEAARAITSR